MRQTDKQIELYKSLTNKQYKAKYGVKKKLYRKPSKSSVKNMSQWRKAVLKRDDYTCQDCGLRRRKGNHVHHIKQKNEYPELKFTVNNGKVLCGNCHNKVHDDLLDYYAQQNYLRAIAH